MTICIAPWTIRNYMATDGKLILISTGASDAFTWLRLQHA